MSDTPNSPTKGFLAKHAFLERSPTLLLVSSLLVVAVGGIVEIAPLFYLEGTIEEVEGGVSQCDGVGKALRRRGVHVDA